MVCVGIDVAKDKHDCCILDSDGTVRADCFTIPNNSDGFKRLLQTIQDCTQKSDKIKVGLEATGHYSYNILGFLLDNGLPTYVINPLHTNLYRKSLSLRKTRSTNLPHCFVRCGVFYVQKTLADRAGLRTLKSDANRVGSSMYFLKIHRFHVSFFAFCRVLRASASLLCPLLGNFFKNLRTIVG